MGRHDLGVLYAENMQHFGCGTALFQPISAADMPPPCIGYIDGNGTWNLISTLEWQEKNGPLGGSEMSPPEVANSSLLKPLQRAPRKMQRLDIEWRVRTSRGVRQWNVYASGQTPTTGLPIGSDVHIKYKSNTGFGAVLIAQKPVTLTSYTDETLFKSWLTVNRAQLLALHGAELRRYGLHVITKTYTTSGCSINAWAGKDKEATISMKAKASMLGELGGDLEWTERLTDKDWSHYTGKEKGDTVVVFFDGIEVPRWEWWWQGLKGGADKADVGQQSRCGSPPGRAQGKTRRQSSLRSPRDTTRDLASDDGKGLQLEDLWGSLTPLHKPSPPISRSMSGGRPPAPRRNQSFTRSVSTPRRLSRYIDYEQRSPAREGHAVHFSPHPSVKISAPDPPDRRLSAASTTTSSSSVRRHEPKATNIDSGHQTLSPRSALQRKPAPLLLRHTN